MLKGYPNGASDGDGDGDEATAGAGAGAGAGTGADATGAGHRCSARCSLLITGAGKGAASVASSAAGASPSAASPLLASSTAPLLPFSAAGAASSVAAGASAASFSAALSGGGFLSTYALIAPLRQLRPASSITSACARIIWPLRSMQPIRRRSCSSSARLARSRSGR